MSEITVAFGSPAAGGVVPPVAVFGPSEVTRRDLVDEYRWAGLSANDSAVLSAFLKQLGVEPDELHTFVPVGGLITIPKGYESPSIERMVEHLYPRRIDAAVRFGKEWWILECKPASRMAGLGQLLSYFYWWHRDCPCHCVTRCVLVCEDCDDDECEAYAAAGVDVAVV